MSAEPFDPSEFQQWDPKTQHIAAEAVRRRIEGNIRAWFCVSPGRACDGKPHEGYPYKHARADQWPPPGEDWAVWAVLSGRGAGKTRTGSEWVRKMSERVPAVGLIGRRGVDVRDTMVEGVGEDPENGAGLILACERAGVPYLWEPSKKLFTFGNGCVAIGFSGEEPDSLRGKNLKAAWLDEPAHMPLIDDVWKMLRLTMRQKGAPGTGRAKILVTTTPLPTKWIKELIVRPTTRVTRVSTYMNIDNLDEAFQEEVLHDMEGTRLGRQEIHGEVLEDIEGALWQAAWIEDNRDNEFDRTITVPERIGGTEHRPEVGELPAREGTTRRTHRRPIRAGPGAPHDESFRSGNSDVRVGARQGRLPRPGGRTRARHHRTHGSWRGWGGGCAHRSATRDTPGWRVRAAWAEVGPTIRVMSVLEIALAAVVGIISAARLTRLLTQDNYPPVVWLRIKYQDRTEGTGWEDLVTCPYCAAPWIMAGIGLWGWLTEFQTAWWVFNVWLAASYLVAMVVVRDGE
jgi:hypothetical protein